MARGSEAAPGGGVLTVYGKPGCALCEAAKDKLRKLGVAFAEVDIEQLVDYSPGWRDDNRCQVLAWYSVRGTLPVIRLDGECLGYPELMRRLRRGGNGSDQV